VLLSKLSALKHHRFGPNFKVRSSETPTQYFDRTDAKFFLVLNRVKNGSNQSKKQQGRSSFHYDVRHDLENTRGHMRSEGVAEIV
jgi:hypothetical protein